MVYGWFFLLPGSRMGSLFFYDTFFRYMYRRYRLNFFTVFSCLIKCRDSGNGIFLPPFFLEIDFFLEISFFMKEFNSSCANILFLHIRCCSFGADNYSVFLNWYFFN